MFKESADQNINKVKNKTMTKLTNDQVEDIFLNYADESVNDELHISLYAFKEAINKAFSLNGVVKQSELLSDENTPKYGTKEWLIMAQEIFKKA